MKSLTILILISLAVTVNARTWTNSSGKSFDGDYISQKEDTVKIKNTKNRKVYEIRKDTLSKADQEYLERLLNKTKKVIELSKKTKLTLIWVEPGEFIMGSPETEKYRNKLLEGQRRVTVSKGFWLGETEVTGSQWQAIMGKKSRKPGSGKKPVGRVRWAEAISFCQKLTQQEQQKGSLPDGYKYDLPDEIQWEYASKAGNAGAFSGSDDIDSVAWYGGNRKKTNTVATKKPNAWGFYDMTGNVMEWCYGWFKGVEPGSGLPLPRSIRGGSALNLEDACRTARRSYDATSPDYASENSGFRIALVPIAR